MTRKEQEALRRLEEALLAQEEPVAEQALLEDTWLECAELDTAAYNSDKTDVDLDAYSEEVRDGSSGSPLGVVLVMVTMVALSAGILLLLKLLGVL